MLGITLPATQRNEDGTRQLYSCENFESHVLYYLQVFGTVPKCTAFSDRRTSWKTKVYEIIIVQNILRFVIQFDNVSFWETFHCFTKTGISNPYPIT
jgi:hypothetical protein